MKKGAWIFGFLAITLLGWRSLSHDRADPKLAFDRFWVDHVAASRDDKFEALFIDGSRPWGRFGSQTWFRGKWEAFHYHVIPRQDGHLQITYPAVDEQEEVVLNARPCRERGFDFCLDITGNSRGQHRYYSRKQWRVRDGNVEAVEDQARAELAPASR